MDTRSEPSSTSANSEDVITQEGKRYSRIPADEAFRIRFDVQLYYVLLPSSRVLRDFDTPESYRRKSSEDHTYANASVINDPTTPFWTNYQYCIEVDPPKPEYVCPT